MKIPALLLMSLSLMVGTQAWAQSPATAPTSLSKRDRIEICKKKQGVPLEPADPQPLSLDGKDGTVTRPIILDQVAPRAVGGQGRVVLESVIDEDGCVRGVKILQSAGGDMDGAAVAAVRQWVFLPATRDGHPVRVRYVLSVNNN